MSETPTLLGLCPRPAGPNPFEEMDDATFHEAARLSESLLTDQASPESNARLAQILGLHSNTDPLAVAASYAINLGAAALSRYFRIEDFSLPEPLSIRVGPALIPRGQCELLDLHAIITRAQAELNSTEG